MIEALLRLAGLQRQGFLTIEEFMRMGRELEGLGPMPNTAERLIYLASPYTHEDPAIMAARFDAVCAAAANLMRDGVHLYAPIAHTHPIARYGLPKGWDYWEQYDRVMLSKCAELWVLQLDGWESSKGVQAEIAIARELGIPVRHLLA